MKASVFRLLQFITLAFHIVDSLRAHATELVAHKTGMKETVCWIWVSAVINPALSTSSHYQKKKKKSRCPIFTHPCKIYPWACFQLPTEARKEILQPGEGCGVLTTRLCWISNEVSSPVLMQNLLSFLIEDTGQSFLLHYTVSCGLTIYWLHMHLMLLKVCMWSLFITIRKCFKLLSVFGACV